ncbi:MAG: class I SAM-dependent methyltransferase [Planctomycetes bacterium]|nr:class I SAM-dependent methyltransferase [Planctomycetota bacterium]
MLSETLRSQFDVLDRFVREKPDQVADLGAGLGHHTQWFLERDMRVLAVDRVLTADLATIVKESSGACRFICADVGRLPLRDGVLKSIWASHCLEHMEDPLTTLREWRRVLGREGMLGVLVPPYKTEIVGRHVFTGWNVGQLMLTLFRTGFRVRDGIFARHGYNVFAVVRRCENPPNLGPNDEILCQYHEHFPPAIEREILEHTSKNPFGEMIGRFQGDIARLGW